MKLQVAFDIVDLEKALSIASQIQDHVDTFEIGSLLIYKHGVDAVKSFRAAFPNKTILVDAKIADRSKEAVAVFIQAGADWITVLAGAGRHVIKHACTTAHELGKRVMLDLLDASSLGQAALEAKSLGADAVLFHRPSDEDAQFTFIDRWEMVRGNTTLPIFVSAAASRETIHELVHLSPAGIILSKEISGAENPSEEIAFYRTALGKNN